MENLTLKQYKLRLLELLKEKAVQKGRIKLSSGKISNFYVDGRLITLTPVGAWLVANIILRMLKGKKIDAVGGPTLGADPIVGALACMAYLRNIPLKTFIVRKKKKEHGMRRLVEGPQLKKGSHVVLIDDVATTGSSLIEAKEILNKMGIKIEYAIVLVDRQEGAQENLKKAGCKLLPIFKKKDLVP
ncbi:MAG: orotate phosphoribosyltransferase [Candidatus Omnitrophica bacterium]|nr:orotate phosphoribosyltransferase [Candidatus Omnitrophota bacterium]MCM8770589.1 orotate phosphoribosyltransferase [Candidatus Omnitrophota bacterium]